MLLDMGNTLKGRVHTRVIVKGKETLNLNVVDVLTAEERI
jgi:hypothetical protein